MNNGCCLNCQTKATKKNKKKKIKEESDEDAMKQEQKVSENENPKTDSNDKKKQSILTWKHSSTKTEKGPSKNLLSEKNDVNPPYSTARSMLNHGGPNPSNRWPIPAVPRPHYPAFPMAPMYGPYGGGGPIQSYYSMPRATKFNGAHISPYLPMGVAAPFPYWGTRPYMDSNPTKRYTSYADNYSYCFI